VLVALTDESDALYARAARDLKRLRRGPFGSTVPVLSETYHILAGGYLRGRLRSLLKHLDVAIVEVPRDTWEEILDWMERYEEHEPDLADAQLVALSAMNASFRVWSYDKEFVAVWRRADGTRVPTTVR
jgi:predicted nucleic acid-binding protein